MKSLLITIAIIAVLAAGGVTLGGRGASAAPASIPQAIGFRDQAGLAVEVTNQINVMGQVVAMGCPDATVISTLLANDALKQRLEAIEQNRRKAGEGADALAQLRASINWEEFLRQDAVLRAKVPMPQ